MLLRIANNVNQEEIIGEFEDRTFIFRIMEDFLGKKVKFSIGGTTHGEQEHSVDFGVYDPTFALVFLDKEIPLTLTATLLAKKVIEEADEREYFDDAGVFILFNEGRKTMVAFANNRLIRIRTQIIVYFSLCLGFTFPVLEVLAEVIKNHNLLLISFAGK